MKYHSWKWPICGLLFNVIGECKDERFDEWQRVGMGQEQIHQQEIYHAGDLSELHWWWSGLESSRGEFSIA